MCDKNKLHLQTRGRFVVIIDSIFCIFLFSFSLLTTLIAKGKLE